VDLGGTYSITKVRITHKGQGRLGTLYMDDAESCGLGFEGDATSEKECAVSGRVLKITLYGWGELRICDLRIWLASTTSPTPAPSLALTPVPTLAPTSVSVLDLAGKAASQHANKRPGSGWSPFPSWCSEEPAAFAIDGDLSTCSCTYDHWPWWQVDLGDVYSITKVRITHQGGSTVGSLHMDSGDTCGLGFSGDGTSEAECVVSGRVLKIKGYGWAELRICDVQIWVK